MKNRIDRSQKIETFWHFTQAFLERFLEQFFCTWHCLLFSGSAAWISARGELGHRRTAGLRCLCAHVVGAQLFRQRQDEATSGSILDQAVFVQHPGTHCCHVQHVVKHCDWPPSCRRLHGAIYAASDPARLLRLLCGYKKLQAQASLWGR